jgi:hypothetical protein
VRGAARGLHPPHLRREFSAKWHDPRWISLGQNHLTPLDLIATETMRDLAMRANDGWLAGDRKPKLRIVSLIDRFLKCNEAPACRVGAPNGQVPHCTCFNTLVRVGRSDGVSPVVGALSAREIT